MLIKKRKSIIIFLIIFLSCSIIGQASNNATISSLTSEDFAIITRSLDYLEITLKTNGKQYFSVWAEIYKQEEKNGFEKIIPIINNYEIKNKEFSFLFAPTIEATPFYAENILPDINIFNGVKYVESEKKSETKNIIGDPVYETLQIEPIDIELDVTYAINDNLKIKHNQPVPFYIFQSIKPQQIEPNEDGEIEWTEIDLEKHMSGVEFKEIEQKIENNELFIVFKYIISDDIFEEIPERQYKKLQIP